MPEQCGCCFGGAPVPVRRLLRLQEQLGGCRSAECCAAPVAADGGPAVNTVLGPVSSSQLGFTLSHEHIYVSSAGIPHVYPEFFPRDRIIRDGVEHLTAYREEGGGTIIDCTTMDLGRDVRLMERVSRDSGVNIVATTGCWVDIPRSWHAQNPDRIAQLYIHEATVGIEGTGIKAGIIKCAHETGTSWVRGKGFSQAGEVTVRAAARAAKVTGLPITTHTEVEEHIGEAQIRIFEEEGVDLNRVYIGHCNDSTDIGYLTRMLRKGVWLGLDRTVPVDWPGSKRPDWKGRAETVRQLIQAGWGHRIMLSHDWWVHLGFMPDEMVRPHIVGNPDGYRFIMRKVLPWLEERGVSAEQTRGMMRDNPRRFFENAR